MQRIRVLVAIRPSLMRELVLATISEQPDIEVMGELNGDVLIPVAVEESTPDFLIIALDEPGKRPRFCDVLLRRHPQLRIVALTAEPSNSVLYSASVEIHSDVVETSEESLLSVLRGGTSSTQSNGENSGHPRVN